MQKTKMAVLLIGMTLLGVLAPASTVLAQRQNNNQLGENIDREGFDQGIAATLGEMRAVQGGDVLADVFALLLGQMFEGVSAMDETLPGTYVFNVTQEEVVHDNVPLTTLNPQFAAGSVMNRIWLADYIELFQAAMANLHPDLEAGIPYMDLNRSVGSDLRVTYKVGVSITVIIYDTDNTFIDAVSRLINAFVEAEQAQTEEAAMETIISAFTYLLVHINDIITGDELIMINPVHYETFTLNGTYGEVHALRYADSQHFNLPIPGDVVAYMNQTAQTAGDEFLDWVLNGGVAPGFQTISWASFSFNLMQIWLKRFHMEIDLGELGRVMANNGSSREGDAALYGILNGMDIDFYVITHTMVTPLLYDDQNDNGLIDVGYQNLTYPNGTLVTYVDSSNTTKFVERIVSDEVRYQVGFRQLQTDNTWTVTTPHVVGAAPAQQVKWGVELHHPEIMFVPVGASPEVWAWSHAYSGQNTQLDHVSLGFTFDPGQEIPVLDMNTNQSTGISARNCTIKLDQGYGKWSSVPAAATGCDMSIVFFSTMLHFRFNIDAEAGTENIDQERLVQGNQTYDHAEGYFTFGREAYMRDDTGTQANPMLGKVDIAGPQYAQYDYANASDVSYHPARTQTIPLALFEGTWTGSETQIDTRASQNSYTVDAFAQADVSAMWYGINYYTLDGTGERILHDPTFSVYMTFPERSVIAVVVIFLIVGFVGIAAVLITKRKNER